MKARLLLLLVSIAAGGCSERSGSKSAEDGEAEVRSDPPGEAGEGSACSEASLEDFDPGLPVVARGIEAGRAGPRLELLVRVQGDEAAAVSRILDRAREASLAAESIEPVPPDQIRARLACRR